jgi:hypothetical protein
LFLFVTAVMVADIARSAIITLVAENKSDEAASGYCQ